MFLRLGAMGLLLALLSGNAGAAVVLSPTHYDLTVEVDYSKEMLRGTSRIELANLSEDPASEVSLLLYRLLRVASVRDERGHDLAFHQAVVAFEDEARLQVHQVLVTLAEPLAPGARTTIEIQYGGYLLGYTETGMLYVHDRIDPTFTILRDDGRRQTYRIVGEDEADPSAGTLSYVSPVAQALMGKAIGDVVEAGTAEAEIVEIK